MLSQGIFNKITVLLWAKQVLSPAFPGGRGEGGGGIRRLREFK